MKMGCVAVVLCWVCAAFVAAQEIAPAPILTDRPDPLDSADLLAGGETFDSQPGGISLRVPSGMKLVRRGSVGGGDDLAQFADEKRNWVLRIRRNTLPEPRRLLSGTSSDNGGKRDESIVADVMNDLLTEHPRAQVLRDDAMTLGDSDVALLAARITLGTQRHLLQQAIIAANSRVYYVLSFSSPTPVAPDADDSVEDPQERLAVRAFEQSLRTVQLADLGRIRQEQDQRLLATREFYDQLAAERMKDILIEEQWLRILRDGKDVGYTYVIEEIDTFSPRDAIVVATRTRMMQTPEDDKSTGDARTPKPARFDSESWMRLTCDRRHESWSTVNVVSDAAGKPLDHSSELGSSDWITQRVLDRGQINTDPNDPKQPPVREDEQYNLKVTHVAKSVTAPAVERQLPPFYLPRALAQLLPRLLPLDRSPAGYLFASYASDARQIMLHYVDVGQETDVKLGGQALRAVPVTERIGQEGAATTHYITRDGKYVGSINEGAKITLLPTDAKALLEIWKDADLSRPQAPSPDADE